MKDYYALEAILLAVQLRHIGFFEDDQSLIIDYVTIDTNTEQLVTLRALPGEIQNDLDIALGE